MPRRMATALGRSRNSRMKVPARRSKEMVSIGGMDSKWGRRLFIVIQANGRSPRLFGNKSQLAEAIKTAGFTNLADRVEEGMAVRVPCRVITKPSPDGKYTNVERVLPVQMPQNNGGRWR